MRELALVVIGNLITAVALSAAAVVDLRVLTPDPFFTAGAVATGVAIVPFIVAWRFGFFMGFGDGAIPVLASHVVSVLWLTGLGAVQVIVPFLVAQRYAAGAWCAPNLTNPLFVQAVALFVFASVLAGELRLLGVVGSHGTWGEHQVRSGAEAVILFGTPIALSALAV